MAIVQMKKVEFHTDEAYKKEIIEVLNSLSEFHKSENPLIGYIRADMVEEVCSNIDAELANYTISEPSIENGDNPPVILKGNFFTEPFIHAVEKNALPLYCDLDPTLLFSVGFCVLFGIMFGDIGQGIILVLIGLFYKKNDASRILARVGVFSIIFGWIYGSIFGNEEFLAEFMHEHNFIYYHFALLGKGNTERLLLLTIAVGAILIILSMMIHIIDCAREKRLKEILADRNGVAGLLFYGSLFSMALHFAIYEKLTPVMWIVGLSCLVVSILMLLLLRKGPMKKRLHYLWHTVLESASSTMSFLMVGCFALAHATLMMIVFKVAEATPVPLLIIILGNALVIGIEATEVYHQCLHLCFKTLLPFIITETED